MKIVSFIMKFYKVGVSFYAYVCIINTKKYENSKVHNEISGSINQRY